MIFLKTECKAVKCCKKPHLQLANNICIYEGLENICNMLWTTEHMYLLQVNFLVGSWCNILTVSINNS